MPKSVFTDAYASLREVLIALREDAGMTQAELSRRLGRHQPFISNIEAGIRRVDLIEFCAIVRVLGGDPKKVFAKIYDQLPMKLDI